MKGTAGEKDHAGLDSGNMPTGVYKITDIPADKVDMVVADYQLDGPQSIERTEQPNSLWIVTATFPGAGENVEVFNA